MNAAFDEITKGMKTATGINSDQLAGLINSLDKPLPLDFISFLKFSNGAVGMIGSNYLEVWKAEDLLPYNKDYLVDEFAPGLFLFGSDGGGEGFGFDYRGSNPKIVRIPFICMDWVDARKIADNFLGFLQRLKKESNLF